MVRKKGKIKTRLLGQYYLLAIQTQCVFPKGTEEPYDDEKGSWEFVKFYVQTSNYIKT